MKSISRIIIDNNNLFIFTYLFLFIHKAFTWSKWNVYLKLLFLGLKMKCSINFYFEIPPCRKLFPLTSQNRRFLPKTTNLVTRNNYVYTYSCMEGFQKKLLFTVIFRPNMIIVDSILEKTTMHSSFIR